MRRLILSSVLRRALRIECRDENTARVGEPDIQVLQSRRRFVDAQRNSIRPLAKPIIGRTIGSNLFGRNFSVRQQKTLRLRRVDAARLVTR